MSDAVRSAEQEEDTPLIIHSLIHPREDMPIIAMRPAKVDNLVGGAVANFMIREAKQGMTRKYPTAVFRLGRLVVGRECLCTR